MTDKARILFVDDEKRVLNAMRGLFRREYDLFLTSEGAEAVRLVEENDVDVIVADQRMPGMTGIEVLSAVKQRSPRTVRILLTGYADPSAVEGSINMGEVFRFLSKPCPPKELRETLSLAITAARTRPEAPAAPRPAPAAPPRPASTAAPKPATPVPTKPVVPPQVAPPAAASPPVATPAVPAPPVQRTPPAANDAGLSGSRPIVPRSPDESSSHWQSVTNVIMSEDTVEETSEHLALTSATLGLNDVSVVVFTVDSEFASTAIRTLSVDRNTVLATTLVKVAEAIQQQNAGVLITDFTSNKAMLQKIIAALKKYMPELVTVVVSSGRDTTDMINLINYGQVFRYVLKPIDPDQLRGDINAAVIRHLYLLNNPESVKRHEVKAAPQSADSSTTVSEFMGKVRDPK